MTKATNKPIRNIHGSTAFMFTTVVTVRKDSSQPVDSLEEANIPTRNGENGVCLQGLVSSCCVHPTAVKREANALLKCYPSPS